jgi:hypothetical protein
MLGGSHLLFAAEFGCSRPCRLEEAFAIAAATGRFTSSYSNGAPV